MFNKIWQFLKQLISRVLSLLSSLKGKSGESPPQKPLVSVPLSDTEYEAIFLQLLEQVNQGFSRGKINAFFIIKNLKESDLVPWLRRFGERLLATDELSESHQELGQRLLLLGDLGLGELSQIAATLGNEILAKFPSKINPIIEAIFIENGLGNEVEMNRKGTEETEENADNWFNRGTELLNQGDFHGAIASYDNAIKIKPDDYEAWNNRGNARFNLGRFEDAIASYDNAIKIKPDFHEAWYNRGMALGNLGRLEDAIGSYDNAIKIKPDFHQAGNNRGVALRKLGRL
jgi:tetratricopeptide (TPR) repeat protein